MNYQPTPFWMESFITPLFSKKDLLNILPYFNIYGDKIDNKFANTNLRITVENTKSIIKQQNLSSGKRLSILLKLSKDNVHENKDVNCIKQTTKFVPTKFCHF